MHKRINLITLIGFALSLLMPIVEVKSRYIHGMEHQGKNFLSDFVDGWIGHWDNVILLFGFRPEVIVIQFGFIIQALIVLKSKTRFKKIGAFLDNYVTYLLLLVSFALNLILIYNGYPKHAVELFFWFGSYIFVGLTIVNGIVKWKNRVEVN